MTNNFEFLKKRKKENYFRKAKKENHLARSFFKLEQIDKKFNIIKKNFFVCDLGCAPGGWLEYLQKKDIKKAIGIDLLEIKKKEIFNKEKIKIIQDDFSNIKKYIKDEEKFDLIISDMAPEFCGNKKIDSGKTHILNLKTIEFSKNFLKKGKNLIIKSFDGEDFNLVKKKILENFEKLIEFKPNSSQKRNCEIFLICRNKK